jgi:transcriptional regulator with XRE-family HTH domain
VRKMAITMALCSPAPTWKAVRKLRVKRGLSQEGVAKLADVHRNYVGGVERGERNIAIVNIDALAHALRVRPAKLLETTQECALVGDG